MKKSVLALAVIVILAPAAALAQSQMPIRVGGTIKAPERTRYVQPVYPEIASQARIQGVVIAEVVVSANGSVTDIQILKSIPLLDQAAIDAVRQWTFAPTTLNGVPVPVIMMVTVSFSISRTPIDEPPTSIQASTPLILADSVPTEWNGVPAIRIGGDIKAPERIKYVPPTYPEVAQQARVSGIVIIEAIIDESGNVAMMKILKSVPLLDQAAADAVGQWKYTPTLVNGVAVPVVMTVTVNFSLQ